MTAAGGDTNDGNDDGGDDDAVMVLADTTTTTQVIPSQHMDYILATALDVYGRRMATVSGDRFVKVWDLNESQEWGLSSSWQAHKSAVTAVDWAHPEFGSLLATGGSDHDVKIWEESSNGCWITKAALTEARRGVTCCQFAPRHWGLKLATGSGDGCVRIYEAVDIMNLAQWVVTATLQLPKTSTDGSGHCAALSWCTGRFDPPTLAAAGSNHQVVIYRYSDSARAWQSVHNLNIGSGGGSVLDVAWAPNVGRRFHCIAVAAEHRLLIFKLSRRQKEQATMEVQSSQEIAANAWRCQWNVTGTVLASSGDGGVVQLWKADHNGEFACVSRIQGDLSKIAEAVAASDGEQQLAMIES